MQWCILTLAVILAANDVLVDAESLKFERDVAATEEASHTVMQFRVVKTDDQNRTFTCLRTEFRLELDLLVGNVSHALQMTNSTQVDVATSNCQTLFLNLNYNKTRDEDDPTIPNTVQLQFTQSQSSRGDDDVEIFYLNQIKLRELAFPGSPNLKGEANYRFLPDGKSRDVNDTTPATPVELEISNSFKCYNGFVLTAPNELDETTSISLKFNQYRLEMYENYDQKATDMNLVSPWKRIYSCDADISHILPILVGCVLGGIILLTLVGYFIARRRSRHAYEEL